MIENKENTKKNGIKKTWVLVAIGVLISSAYLFRLIIIMM